MLGVTDRQAGSLKLAYRKQCLIWHPDRNTKTPEDTAKVLQAPTAVPPSIHSSNLLVVQARNMFWRVKEACGIMTHAALCDDDACGNAAQCMGMTCCMQAYDVLSDPRKKVAYLRQKRVV